MNEPGTSDNTSPSFIRRWHIVTETDTGISAIRTRWSSGLNAAPPVMLLVIVG